MFALHLRGPGGSPRPKWDTASRVVERVANHQTSESGRLSSGAAARRIANQPTLAMAVKDERVLPHVPGRAGRRQHVVVLDHHRPAAAHGPAWTARRPAACGCWSAVVKAAGIAHELFTKHASAHSRAR